MLNIGTKIKELRKERKMTLAQVAGDRLTKGMLSLIENGKAQPSMESLQYIASQLEIDVAELIQSEDNKQVHETFMQVEQLYSQFKKEFNKEQRGIKGQELLQLIHPLVQSGNLKGANYEEVRLLELYLLVRYLLNIDRSIEPFLPLAKMYENIHAYSKVLECFTRLGGIKFEQHQLEQALDYLLEGKQYIERYNYLIGDFEKLDYYYNLTVIYAAANNDQKMEEYLNLALNITKEKGILYRFNDFYRLLFFINCSKGDAEKSKYYLNKLRLFMELFENPFDEILHSLTTLFYINRIEQDYPKVLALPIDNSNLPEDALKHAMLFINGEYAYAHWQLKQYDEAKKCLATLFVPEATIHPIDLAIIYRSYAVRALCAYEEGDIENAKRDILYAMDGVKEFKETLDKQFILQAYEHITQ
ncbi:helix-turn-helix transcriptional regulator [Metasolibacillus meyeri]|uniref:Helix-turn-helix transcriptional regulator n=1 Tax=Metasolibacillus meyeri TaxID=1071052 RepID=A0AAW9NN87_9BACL|nr:helix-turn-helix transcriptional regulator [Metasolibacillus meyeri]MEC1177897.1 helix-turn-helix transcriptional regulator [Metasolibacillus meyeri]